MVVQDGPERQAFDLSGGALCLDFANTLDDRPSPHPNDFLRSYADVLEFGCATGSLAVREQARLRSEAERRPADAEAALTRALNLREVIFRLFLALADGRPTSRTGGRQGSSDDLAALNRALAASLVHARVAAETDRGESDRAHGESDRFAWAWADDPLDLDRPIWPIARSAADLLTSRDLASLRRCASERCDWLFLDTSRNGSRRWCSMRTCGNREKARRHHVRVKAASPPS